MAYSTKIADLLDDVKAAIQKQVSVGGTLSSVKQVRVGPVRNPAAFPFISVVPIEERNSGIRNGIMINVRTVSIEVFAHKAKSKLSMRAALGMIEKVKDIFKLNAPLWQINEDGMVGNDPTVYDTQIGAISHSDKPVPFRNGFIHSASLELICFSKDQLAPDITSSYNTYKVVACDAKTLVDNITIIYKKYKTGAQTILSNIKSFKDFTLPPVPAYPIIYIGIEGETRDHTHAGRDVIDRDISINILTKMGTREDSLRKNLNVANLCRQILIANNTFQGKVVHYDYDGILFGQLQGDRGELLYGSSLKFTTQNYETMN